MNNIIIIYFTFFIFIVKAQPAPETSISNNTNLNDISLDLIKKCLSSRCSIGTIVIDKTTNLNNIGKLSEFKNLELKVDLETFPKIISPINWKTEALKIDGNNILKDLTTINDLKHLKILYIENFIGEKVSNKQLNLKNLEFIIFYNSPNLKNINFIKNLEELIGLDICTKNSIQKFPRLKKGNKLTELCIETNGDTRNLKYLEKLKKLVLVTKINHFPNYFPKKLAELQINGRNQSTIKNLNALNRYTNLELLSFGNLIIEDSVSTFPKIELTELNFGGKEIGNISFILKFKKIKTLNIYDIEIASLASNSKSTTTFENVKILASQKVDYTNLFKLPITNSLSIQYTDIDNLPNIDYLKKIPYLLIENNPKLLQEKMIRSENWKIVNNGE